ncbi:hypothetical protein R3P38DRAFT_3178587 [Favolaschia claudopus]|uniref:Uncharacterized protein n=1 Tax=Favolaschia claudopus TaxID=2862362 RepID=A0AAW0CSR2_9AGAR
MSMHKRRSTMSVIRPLRQTSLVALRAIRRQTIYEDPEEPEFALVSLPALKSNSKFPTPSGFRSQESGSVQDTPSFGAVQPVRYADDDTDADSLSPLIRDSEWLLARAAPPKQQRLKKAFAPRSHTGIENHPPLTTGIRRIRRSYSLPAAHLHWLEDAPDDLDETMPEVREALHVNAALYAKGYRYERVEADAVKGGITLGNKTMMEPQGRQ